MRAIKQNERFVRDDLTSLTMEIDSVDTDTEDYHVLTLENMVKYTFV